MEKSNNSAVLNKGKTHRRGVSRSSNGLKTHELPNCQNKPFHYILKNTKATGQFIRTRLFPRKTKKDILQNAQAAFSWPFTTWHIWMFWIECAQRFESYGTILRKLISMFPTPKRIIQLEKILEDLEWLFLSFWNLTACSFPSHLKQLLG